jgi:Leucine-rich repeat (LRR) protein
MSTALLNFKGKQLSEFPTVILDDREITHLNLEDNQISIIPEWITELSQLKVLSLGKNCLTNIDVLTRLPSLEILHISNNNITELPAGISRLKRLRRLFANGNQFSHLTDELCELTELRMLLLADNKLHTISPHLGNLYQLETLNLFRNQLTSIPESIGALTLVDYLQLSDNAITQLPESIRFLKSLYTFEIFSNKLTALPVSLNVLHHLRALNVGDNNISRIENIPACISHLSIYGNPVQYIAPEIFKRFETPQGDQSTYLFIDATQYAGAGIDKASFGDQLKVIDIASGKINWRDMMNMPMELQKKWGLEKTISTDKK